MTLMSHRVVCLSVCCVCVCVWQRLPGRCPRFFGFLPCHNSHTSQCHRDTVSICHQIHHSVSVSYFWVFLLLCCADFNLRWNLSWPWLRWRRNQENIAGLVSFCRAACALHRRCQILLQLASSIAASKVFQQRDKRAGVLFYYCGTLLQRLLCMS